MMWRKNNGGHPTFPEEVRVDVKQVCGCNAMFFYTAKNSLMLDFHC